MILRLDVNFVLVFWIRFYFLFSQESFFFDPLNLSLRQPCSYKGRILDYRVKRLILGFCWPLLYCDLSPLGFSVLICKKGNV